LVKKPISHDPEFWATAATIKTFTERRLCIAKSDADPCEGPIIRAHTVPRSQLQKIAADGHVYAMQGDLPTFQKTGGQVEIVKRGIGNFSVLNCFCEKHDRELFACVETEVITGTREQVAALHYRAIASELYRKYTAVETAKHILSTKAGERNQRLLEAGLVGQQLGLIDSGKNIARCERAIFGEQYDELGALVIQFNRLPSIMTVGAYNPLFDYSGRRLQSLANEEVYAISFSILTAGSRAVVILAWLKPSEVATTFVEALCGQPQNLWTTLLIQTAFSHLENTCANMSWWDGLKNVERQSLLGRIQQTLHLPGPHSDGSYMTFGGIKFDDWKYHSHSFVNL
jgi:hypothetical protein